MSEAFDIHLTQKRKGARDFVGIIPFAILAIALLWYAALVLRFPTHGAIGDDPATYVQMALDLAMRGTVVHEFPLFTKLFAQGLSWDAFLTPGYHIVRESGAVAPNFAFGFSLLLAFAYRLFGENALYWATPLMGALSLIATFALGNELLCNVSVTKRRMLGALAVLILATSPKQIQLALVPMSDVPTQLFCVLALWCALLARPHRFSNPVRSDVIFAALCGMSLGMAYLIRHSALAMLVPLAIVMVRWGGGRRERVALMAMAAAFAIVIAPDLLYRANVLGSVFAVESPESAQMVWLDAPRQFLEMLRALFSVTGFGPLFLFVPLGWWFLWRAKNEFAVWVLAAWLLAFMLLHAPLRLTGVFENSLRYVLPAYPALALSVSAAAILLLEAARQAVRASRTRLAKQSLLAYAIALSGIIALAIALRAFVAPERFAARAYGWMSAETRRDFESLNTQLPPDAVIGVPDQIAGAAILYGQRDVFRPGNFVEPVREVSAFLEKMKSENRAVYLLGDWNCAADAPLSERLPQWLENYTGGEVQGEVRGLPFGCAFPLRQMR